MFEDVPLDMIITLRLSYYDIRTISGILDDSISKYRRQRSMLSSEKFIKSVDDCIEYLSTLLDDINQQIKLDLNLDD